MTGEHAGSCASLFFDLNGGARLARMPWLIQP